MLPRVILALAVSVVIIRLGFAEEAQIGSTAITLPPPEGFCEMTEQDPSDNRMIQAIAGMLASAKIEPLAMSADCSQLEAWRGGLRPLLDDFAQYQTPVLLKDSSFPRALAIHEVCMAMRAHGGSIEGMTDDLNERLHLVMEDAKFNELKFLGVLTQGSDACYFGLLQKLRTELGTEKTQIAVTAITIVNGKVVNFVIYTVYEGADTVTALLARQQRNIAALLAANGG